MSIANTRLVLLPFPQHWDGEELSLRLLVGAFGNPRQPLAPGEPQFAKAKLKFTARLIPGLDNLPAPADVTQQVALQTSAPTQADDLFEALETAFGIDPNPSTYVPPAATVQIRKFAPPSYLEATGFSRLRTEFAVTDCSHTCALNGEPPKKKPPAPPVPPKWEEVMALAMRQPVLARHLGVLYRSGLKPPAGFFADGGWLYVALDSTSDYVDIATTTAGFVRHYVARIPPLDTLKPRAVFAPVLFPLIQGVASGEYDEMFREAELYDDGFARLLHTFQADRADVADIAGQGEQGLPPQMDQGIKLGWDDEQVLIWLNRQFTDDPRNNPLTSRDTPLGVRGFRVDVREVEGPGPWSSLVKMEGDLSLGGHQLGRFDGEMCVELAPSQFQGERDGTYWLPPYFTQWSGSSLIARQDLAAALDGRGPAVRVLKPKDADDVPLKYGREYDFRVRLVDLSGGGPAPDDPGEGLPASAIRRCRFRRYLPPGRVHMPKPEEEDDGQTLVYQIPRPLIGYPAALYTELPNPEALLLADQPQAKLENRQPAITDPDVALLRIDVAIGSLQFDPLNERTGQPRQHLYTTVREFPADLDDALELRLTFADEPDIAQFPAPPAAGDLPVPTAREVYVTLTPVARTDPAFEGAGLPDPVLAAHPDIELLKKHDPKLIYFGTQSARMGGSATFQVRREAASEPNLISESPEYPFQALFLQPDPADDAYTAGLQAAGGKQTEEPESITQRFARRLGLDVRDTTFSGLLGRRNVIGCSAAVRHLLSPESASITVASKAELTGQWLVAIPLLLERDWSWDGFDDAGLEVRRSINGAEQIVGSITLARAIGSHALRPDGSADRSSTDLLFLDAIDPKPQPGKFPEEIIAQYTVSARFKDPAADPVEVFSGSIRLPIAAPPSQVARLRSAGIALSPYVHDETYSSTEPRRKLLWLEFEDPVADPGDAYFARVLAHAPDPILTSEEPSPPPGRKEPPLNIDPELIRSIIPNQSTDRSGLGAMQRLIPAKSDTPVRHFLLPLPEGFNESSPELFGFFVYEIRVGHADKWSTARARFGPPLRVAGVQHAAPPLSCSVSRFRHGIRISAPYAMPIAYGRLFRADPPRSDLWGLLYAQVRQADGEAWRNVLLGRTHLGITDAQLRGRAGSEVHGFGFWDQDDVAAALEALSLPLRSPLSVIAVEMLPQETSPFADPLGLDLGQVRILRTSPLTPVPAICLE